VVMQDRTLVCRDCGTSFTFTVGEQQFYQSRGLLHDPARCPGCRTARRRAGGGGGGSGSGGGGGGSGFRSDQPRTFYPAVCAACGASTEVPFEPRQGRPVYCRECYEANRETTSF
jgi:CxxC-x17-CxxC domain-containing protein